jgi:predicted RecB family nuclease
MLRLITATHLYRYLLCEYSATLAFHGDEERRVPPHEGLRLLLDLGNRHEAAWVAEHCADWVAVADPQGDWEVGSEATKRLLGSGVPGVLQGVLLAADRVGKPDLLRRETGASVWGDFHYVAGDVKSSARPHGEQVMQVLFYARLLEEIQGRMQEYGYLIMADGREERFEVAPLLPIFNDALAELRQIRDGERQTRLHLCHECGACPWRVHCRQEALRLDDLSRVPGVSRGMAELLRSEGLETVTALTDLVPERARELILRGSLPAQVLARLQRRARAVARGTATILSAPEVPAPPAGLYVTATVDPRREGALVVIGVLAVDGQGGERREVQLTTAPAEEEKLWHWLLQQVATVSDARPGDARSSGAGGASGADGGGRKGFRGPPIFHSGDLTPQVVEALERTHGGPRAVVDRLHDEAVDLGRALLRSIALPTPSASLRAYAAHVAARTQQEGGTPADAGGDSVTDNGEDSVEIGREPEYGGSFGHCYPWHERWIATGSPSWKQKIFTAVEEELEALRALRLHLFEAAERARSAKNRGKSGSNGERGNDGARPA